jgi:UDP-N-acetylmuramate dehydrogenase
MPAPRASSPASVDLERRLNAIHGVRVFSAEPLARHTSMGVGGPADWFLEVDLKAALGPLRTALAEARIPGLMLGGGSNTLFGEAGYRGAVIHLGGEFRTIELGAAPETISAGAAANLSAVMKFAQRQGLAGIEFGVGIPGTLGGALAGNAGAGGEDVCSLAESVQVLAGTGTIETLRRGQFAYTYRNSELRGWTILGATLKLRPATAEEIKAAIDRHLSKRWEQPLGEKSSGCMFKNPEGGHAGELIDRAGLKGLRIGGVRVSGKHANFMINDGSARAEDIETLMNLVRTRVRESTGIELESEVRLIDPST